MLTVDVQIATEHTVPTDKELVDWALIALDECADGELTIRVVGEEEIQQLNAEFRHIDKITNVLSFPADWKTESGIPYIGDVAICAAVVEGEAAQQSKNPKAHWAHMVIHGVLHLCGYDHQQDNEAHIMESRETALLETLGYENPYNC